MLYLAKKYKLPSLNDKCTEYLEENLDASNVFHMLPDGQRYEEKDQEDHCWKVMDDQTNEAVQSEGFVAIEKSVLEELVQPRDSFNVREAELLKAVDCWATEQSKARLSSRSADKERVM